MDQTMQKQPEAGALTTQNAPEPGPVNLEESEPGMLFDGMSRRLMGRCWIVLTLIGVMLIALGVLHNDLARVFTKAATICLECVGIG